MVIIWLCFPIDPTGNWAQTLRVDAGCLVESIHPSWSLGLRFGTGGFRVEEFTSNHGGLTVKNCDLTMKNGGLTMNKWWFNHEQNADFIIKDDDLYNYIKNGRFFSMKHTWISAY